MYKNIIIIIQLVLLAISAILWTNYHSSGVLSDDTAGAGIVTTNISESAIGIKQLETELSELRADYSKSVERIARRERIVKERERIADKRERGLADREAKLADLTDTLGKIRTNSDNLEEGQRGLDNILSAIQARGTITISK